jgi:phospholipid/cholesterol/gamma-HCH transport system ATP-binding protein
VSAQNPKPPTFVAPPVTPGKRGIQFIDIKKSFGPKAVLHGVSFEVKEGEVFFIIGASGVGKSVLIKHLVGLLYPDSGEIWLDGEEVSKFDEVRMGPVRKKCAMVFQHSTLFDSLTCVENIALPLRKHKNMTQKEALAEGKRFLLRVHMQDFADKYPTELGDGMRKRVAIARALSLDPRYVLFDEPTTSLDPVSARRVDRLIHELSDSTGVTSIVVSHDLTSIFSIAQRIVMLYKGHVKMLGTQDDFQRCEDGVVHQFIRGHATGPMEM